MKQQQLFSFLNESIKKTDSSPSENHNKDPDSLVWEHQITYEYKDGDLIHDDVVSTDKAKKGYADIVAVSKREYPTSQKTFKTSTGKQAWFGVKYDDIKVVKRRKDADPQNPGPAFDHSVNGQGEAVIVIDGSITPQELEKLYDSIERIMDNDVSQMIEQAFDDINDSDAYESDPYKYFGLSKSDFK